MDWVRTHVAEILDSLADSVLIIDRDYRIVFVNRAMINFCAGMSKEAVLGRKCHDIAHQCSSPCPKECISEIVCPHSEVLRTGRPLSVVHVHALPDGQERIVDITASPIRDDKGDISYVIEVLRDVTDAEKTKKALHENEEKYRRIIETSLEGVWTTDAEGKTNYVNRQAAAMLDYPLEEILGRSPLEFMFPEDLPGRTRSPNERTPAFPEQTEFRMRRKDGTEMWISSSSSPIFSREGDYRGALAMLTDITKRRQTDEALRENEEFLNNILESMGEGLVVIDHDYRIIAANKAYCRQVHLPCENILGKYCFEISHHDDKPCFECGEDCAARHTFDTGESHVVVHTHFDSEGEPVHVELKSYPLRNRRGEIVSVIEVISNITEKKKLEDQLRHAQKMEAVGTLTGGIAHDFNNILTAIIGYASILQMKMKEGDPLLADVNHVLASAERAAGLTHSLLAFSRKQTINPKVVNLNEIIKGAEKLLSRLIQEDIEFEIAFTEQDLTILADQGQIEQVLMNMVTNARDAMPGGGKLAITTDMMILDKEFLASQDDMRPGLHALVAISDTGVGMDEKTREKIFEPFFTTKEVGKGTGLGLAIVYGIIKQHHGLITVSSEPGRGTTFRIYLPLYGSDIQTEEVSSGGASAAPGGAETCLVAEDNEAVRQVVTTVLRGAGYTVIEAVNGEDAVRKFIEQRDRIQILLFDVTMPKKNGFAAYKEIKRMNPAIKTVLMSGYTDIAAARDEAAKEAVPFISKPVAPAELLKTVRKALDA